MSIAVSVKKLKKVYKGKIPFTAVDEISFDVQEGEILGLLGPNGSGKTTTIQMLLGTLTPSSGSIEYFGKDLAHHRSEILSSVSFASTYTSLPYILTVAENLDFYGRLYGMKGKEITQKADPLLERFGILEKKKQPVSSLSAGQITRLMLVKAFFTDPRVILLDEPTASLDPNIAMEVCDFLSDRREKTGISILFTSHKMDEVAELCDRTIFLKEGKIIADDLPENLAKSISTFRLRLTIGDGMKRTVAIAENQGLPYSIEHRSIQFSLDEKSIPPFLNALMQAGVAYTSIQVQEPSLEDYFLKLVEKKL